MESFRSLGKRIFGLVIGVVCGAAIVATLAGCSSDGTASGGGGSDPDYSDNLFYIPQAPPPAGPRRAHVDFFDKECGPTGGSDANHDPSFTCRYSDD